MNRALVWTVGGFTVLIAGLLGALWLGTAPRGEDPPSVAAAVLPTAPPTPAPPVVPTSAPAAIPPGADGGSAAPVPAPAASDASANPRAAPPPEVTAVLAERKAEHDRSMQEHRSRMREHGKQRREQHARAREERRQGMAARQALRPPDPNRPPPERLRMHSGSGIIPGPAPAAAAGVPQ